MKMDERDWILLSLIGQDKSLSEIAEELYISQPALSYRIKKIESYFNTELVKRNNRRLQVTPQGAEAIKFANLYLTKIDNLRQNIVSIGNKPQGALIIGASSAIAEYMLPTILSEYSALYPDVELNLVTGFSDYLIGLLRENKIHVAFLREDIEWVFYKRKISSEDIYLVSKDPIDIKELPNLSRVTFKTNPSLQEIISNWWDRNFTTPPYITMTVDNAGACKEIIKTGLGYSIMPDLTLGDTNALQKVPLFKNEKEQLKRHTWIYGSSHAEEYITSKSFLEYVYRTS